MAVQRRLAAILAADVAGYSRLMGEDEEGTCARFNAHLHDLIEPAIASRRGRIVKTTGDALLVEFASVVDAVQCAADIQKGMAERNTDEPDDRRIVFRIGVNLGDVIIEGDDIHGDGVNVAARVEGLAEPGGICISGTVFDQIGTKLDLAIDDLGPQSVKNIAEPVRTYRVRVDSATPTSTPGGDAPVLPLPDKPSIAVLPFDNMSGDTEQEYFGDGITEDIITALSHIRQFFVVARNTIFAYKGQAVAVQTVAEDLGVRYVLEGSVRKSGNRVRITAQLIEARTGNHLWADRYDRELADIFDIQDDITQSVAGAMDPELGRAEQRRALAKPPDNLDAWDLYQRGMFHMYKRTKDDNVEALRLFQEATGRDPNFAGPYGCMARTQIADLLLNYVAHDPKEILRNGRRAVDLDDQDAKSYYALGISYVMAMRDGEAANRAFEEGRRINPNDAQVLNGLAKSLTCLGRAEEAMAWAEQAVRLSPADQNIGLFYGSLTLACLCLRRHEEAVEWGQKARQKTPSWIEWIALPSALAHLGRDDDASEVCAELTARWPSLTVSVVRECQPITYSPYLDHLIDGLRKAGLPQ